MNGSMFLAVYAVKTWMIVSIVIILALIVALGLLGRYGKKLQKKQEDAQQQIQAAAQSVSFLVVDKKRIKLKESGLPQLVIDQTPKYMRGQKVPIVRAKIGPKIMPLICDEKIFDQVPLHKEVRATVSGIYITGVKGLRGNLEEKPKKKKWHQRMMDKLQKASKEK